MLNFSTTDMWPRTPVGATPEVLGLHFIPYFGIVWPPICLWAFAVGCVICGAGEVRCCIYFLYAAVPVISVPFTPRLAGVCHVSSQSGQELGGSVYCPLSG